MGKKSRLKKNITVQIADRDTEGISEAAEIRFKQILKIMSWIVGICFFIIITLPNFEFSLLDFVIKAVFFIGFLNLLLFAMLEFFGITIKKQITKYLS
jgi:hypothetical protein